MVVGGAAYGLLAHCFRHRQLGTDMPNVSETKHVPYGEHKDHTLDIYSPKENAKPVVLVYFYGGGWSSGTKENYRFVAHRFTQEGYHVVIPDYRKYPEVSFPSFVEDTAAAIAHVKSQFPNKKIVIMGHSAGAYNIVMALADPKYLHAHGLSTNDVAGAIAVSGPYNFTPEEEQWQAVFNHMDDYTPMQANSYIDRALPPLLLLHGTEDDLVGEINVTQLREKLDAYDSPYSYKPYEGAGHLDIIGTLGLKWSGQPPTAQDTVAFIEALDE